MIRRHPDRTVYTQHAITLFRIYLLIASILAVFCGFVLLYSLHVMLGVICLLVGIVALILAAVAPKWFIDRLVDWGAF